MNPYAGAPDYRFWRRAISRVNRQDFDPVVAPRFRLAAEDKIATAGSCFAQHISARLRQIGFNYFMTETGEDLNAEERDRRQFGVFSARFGNVYTTRQLLQLHQEAYGDLERAETAWRRPDGRYVDPYRPNVEPEGFANPQEVQSARSAHLGQVRALFEEADLLIFTLGLTECWRSRDDGSVFPLAPGIVAGVFDEGRYEYHNLTVAEVEADLSAFLARARDRNPSLKVLLTVSPVPLIATNENRNVLVATTYSKSVLRVAVESIWKSHDFVDYFPSYEIITGSYAFGAYYEDDAREANRFGVAHAMRCFTSNYIDDSMISNQSDSTIIDDSYVKISSGIVCDEEMIEAITV